ncbi:hypothetical protein [Burkholderia sp. AU16741]|uniref:hypothetical protein n=1 Tax=Burkholderia sp. AU16741 TaxID=2015347 RepID=UPI00117F532B|nr:hypothetical protein [Burkholderia sp. AU16741]
MATDQPPKRRQLPSGHEESAYKGYEKWPLHRWAWEFLCRNEEFIAACRTPARTPGEELSTRTRIARQFHLKKFKHCDEPYQVGAKPAFNVIGIWRCTERQRGINCEDVSIRQGEVLIRFNPEAALYSSNALTAQLLMAEKTLKEHARMLARLQNTRLPRNKARIGTVGERIRWLRMLDAKRHAQSAEARSRGEAWSQPEIYRNLFPTVAKRLGREELRAKFKNAFRTAEKCAQHTYLEMVLAGQIENASRHVRAGEAAEL